MNMDSDEIFEALKSIALEWEEFECISSESDEWCDGAEYAKYKCAEELLDFIEENS